MELNNTTVILSKKKPIRNMIGSTANAIAGTITELGHTAVNTAGALNDGVSALRNGLIEFKYESEADVIEAQTDAYLTGVANIKKQCDALGLTGKQAEARTAKLLAKLEAKLNMQ